MHGCIASRSCEHSDLKLLHDGTALQYNNIIPPLAATPRSHPGRLGQRILGVAQLKPLHMDGYPRSRPTAVNLADSANKLKATTAAAAGAVGATSETVVNAVVASAEAFLVEDIAANKVCTWEATWHDTVAETGMTL